MNFRFPVLVRVLVGLTILVGLGAPSVCAQEVPSRESGVELARFGDAQALAVDPLGRLYVADAARDVVEVYRPDGTRQMVLGGSGTGPGAFDTPSDVDPTNGQLILVADTYNGRIQRFSEDGQYLESLPVGRTDRGPGEGWSFQEGRGGDPSRGSGRPIAVVRDNDGTLFVLDARSRQLLIWSDVGRSGRLSDVGGSRLQDPVALAIGEDRRLYVADAGREAVLVYDTFGTFRRTLPLPSLPSVRALTVSNGRLLIVCARRVLIWERRRGLVAEHKVKLSAPLVDVSVGDDGLYLLTATRLLRPENW